MKYFIISIITLSTNLSLAQDLDINKKNFINNVCTGEQWEVMKKTEFTDTNPKGVSLSNLDHLKMRKEYFVVEFNKDGSFKATPYIKNDLITTFNGSKWIYNEETNQVEIWEGESKKGEVEITWLTKDYFSFKTISIPMESEYVYMFRKLEH